jgi:uroporphyrinogen decarboxylase
LGILMSGECVYDELEIPEDYWRYEQDEAWRLDLHRRYNDLSEEVVGRRLLSETPIDPSRCYPPIKGLHDVFEARNVWHDRSWWLQPAASNERELEALLDRAEARDLRAFLLPENWDAEKRRLRALGVSPPLYRSQRGPVTFAMSVYGVENLIFLIQDNPSLAARFRDAILSAMLGIARVLDEEAGLTPQTSPRGFYFLDDNCCLLTPRMYERFAYPILEGVFSAYSPSPGDLRGQHSDSAMGHLLPLLGSLGLTSVNFGPTLRVDQIRRHCPLAVIDGQLAPFTFSRNDEEGILLEVLRDLEAARPARGLRLSTAGSINNGSRLTGLRLIMSAIQHFGRYP